MMTHAVKGKSVADAETLAQEFRDMTLGRLDPESGENHLGRLKVFAGVRDLVSFLKHEKGKTNPLRRPDGKPAITRAHGFGVSQSGRFLRHFLYLGFNADEHDRRAGTARAPAGTPEDRRPR